MSPSEKWSIKEKRTVLGFHSPNLLKKANGGADKKRGRRIKKNAPT